MGKSGAVLGKIAFDCKRFYVWGWLSVSRLFIVIAIALLFV